MADNVQVSCITKRGDHYDPHERIGMLGGMHHGKPWKQSEDAIIAELEKPDSTRRWNYYTNVGNCTAWVLVIAVHLGRKYLKTEPDRHPENNLLHLDYCP